MVLSEEKRGPVAVLCIEGRIDPVTSPELEGALLEMMDRGERCIVLDMSAAEYVSSAGLRALLIGAKRMREVGGSISLAGLRPAIKDVLAVTGFLNLFRTFRSAADAVDELGGAI